MKKSLQGKLVLGFFLSNFLFFGKNLKAGTELRLNRGVIKTADLLNMPSSINQMSSKPSLLEKIKQKIKLSLNQNKAKSDWIIQFYRAPSKNDILFLQNRGLKINGYLPDDALVVDGSINSEILQMNNNIYAVLPYEAHYKLANDLGGFSVFNSNETLNVIVKLFASANKNQARRVIENLNSASDVDIDDTNVSVTLNKNDIYKLAQYSFVEHIQLSQEFRTMDMIFDSENAISSNNNIKTNSNSIDPNELTGYETGSKVINVNAMYELGIMGQGQIGAFADTGLDSGDFKTIHQDFQSAISYAQIYGLFSNSWGDRQGHGTHVGGSIVGRGRQSHGYFRGVAHGSQVVAQSMWMPWTKNIMVPSKLEKLFLGAYQRGARVHSNSWGGGRSFGIYDNFARSVDAFTFKNQDFLIVIAAGNSGVDKNQDGRVDAMSVTTPGTAKNALTVGASENQEFKGGYQMIMRDLKSHSSSWPVEPLKSGKLSDNPNGIAVFSSRGPTVDGRLKPEIVAPGTNILSTRSQNSKAGTLWGAYNDYYTWSGGTSMATPITAGAALLVRQWIQQKHQLSSPSAALVKAALMHSADDMFPGQYGMGSTQEILTLRPNNDEGYGRINLGNLTKQNVKTNLIDEKEGVSLNEEKVYSFKMDSEFKLIANLVYSDAPASPNASASLVNDLDLILQLPDGKEISRIDHVNNHEIIEQNRLPAGNYKLIVKGKNVPMGLNGKQPFALIFSLSSL